MIKHVSHEEFLKGREALISLILTDPYAMRMLQKLRTHQAIVGDGMAPPITSVVDALGERQLMALTLLAEDQLFSVVDPDMEWTARVVTAHAMLKAEVFLWFQNILIESQAMQLPPHVISPNILPYDTMYFTFENALNVVNADESSDPYTFKVDWLLIVKTSSNMVFTFNRDDRRAGEASIESFVANFGDRWPEDFNDIGQLFGQFLTLLAFLNSPYIGSERERPDRAARREWSRVCADEPGTVHMVRLRNPTKRTSSLSEDSGRLYGQDSHWHVRGHLRAQWYPSEQAHHVIWIAPFIKGDLSKPLRRKIYGVVR